jgi:(p)ppGpp synthase/HD superfamily hydrolase
MQELTLIEKAILLAFATHSGKKDKGGMPYLLHPLRVMHDLTTIDEKIVALLHDVIEDGSLNISDLALQGLSRLHLHAIELLTHKPDVTYQDYIRAIKPNGLARRVKLADLTDNMDMERLVEIGPDDLVRLEKYHQAWIFLNS